jgi:periplasmic copper chaperone A
MKLLEFLPKTTLLLAAFAVSACQQQKPAGEDAAPEAKPAGQDAAPDAKPGLSASDGVLVLPAVKGRPGAAYFTVRNGSARDASIAAVHVDGASKAEMHETRDGKMAALGPVPLKPGETIKFARGGKHVMTFDLDSKLAPGGTTEMTLTFAGGDKLSTTLKVESAGDAGMQSAHQGH